MGSFLPFLLIATAAMAFVVAAHPPPSKWASIPNDRDVQSLGAFAVGRQNEQTHDTLKLLKVVDALVLDRGTEHYTFHLMLKVLDAHNSVKYFKVEVFHDLSAPGEPAVLNLGYFVCL